MKIVSWNLQGKTSSGNSSNKWSSMRTGDPDLIFLQETGHLREEKKRFEWTEEREETFHFWTKKKGPVDTVLTYKAGKLEVPERTRSIPYRILFQQWGVDIFRCSLAIMIHPKHGDIGLASMSRIFQGPETHHIDPNDKKSAKSDYHNKMRPLIGVTLKDTTYFSYHAPSAYNAAKITGDYINKVKANGVSKWVLVGDFNCIPSANYEHQTDSVNLDEDESDTKEKKPRQNLINRLEKDLGTKNPIKRTNAERTTQVAQLDWGSEKLFVSSNIEPTHIYTKKPGSTLDYMVSNFCAGIVQPDRGVQIDESDHRKQVLVIDDGEQIFASLEKKSKPPVAPAAPSATAFGKTPAGMPALNVAAVAALNPASGNRRSSLGKRPAQAGAISPRSQQSRKSSKSKR
ncbi:MAG: hypothetical protein AAGA53_07270 [Pseudomonadota bacterium]